jgi:periplasmic protein TonB
MSERAPSESDRGARWVKAPRRPKEKPYLLHASSTLAWLNFSASLFRLSAMERLQTALFVSAALHAVFLLGTQFKMADPRKFRDNEATLDVLLVNAKSATQPHKPQAYAQANLDGGGNVDANRRAKSPLPAQKEREMASARKQQATDRELEQLETEARKLVTQLKSAKSVKEEEPKPPPTQTDPARSEQALNTDLARRGQQIASLEAQIAKQWEMYQQRPKRKFIGARTAEYRFARYVDDWRNKVEKIGNANYPEAARKRRLYGNLLLTVAIRANGSVENIRVLRSSGHKILDAAAIHIVELAAPFGAFPDNIRSDTDVLHITRTWNFTRANLLQSE